MNAERQFEHKLSFLEDDSFSSFSQVDFHSSPKPSSPSVKSMDCTEAEIRMLKELLYGEEQESTNAKVENEFRKPEITSHKRQGDFVSSSKSHFQLLLSQIVLLIASALSILSRFAGLGLRYILSRVFNTTLWYEQKVLRTRGNSSQYLIPTSWHNPSRRTRVRFTKEKFKRKQKNSKSKDVSQKSSKRESMDSRNPNETARSHQSRRLSTIVTKPGNGETKKSSFGEKRGTKKTRESTRRTSSWRLLTSSSRDSTWKSQSSLGSKSSSEGRSKRNNEVTTLRSLPPPNPRPRRFRFLRSSAEKSSKEIDSAGSSDSMLQPPPPPPPPPPSSYQEESRRGQSLDEFSSSRRRMHRRWSSEKRMGSPKSGLGRKSSWRSSMSLGFK